MDYAMLVSVVKGIRHTKAFLLWAIWLMQKNTLVIFLVLKRSKNYRIKFEKTTRCI